MSRYRECLLDVIAAIVETASLHIPIRPVASYIDAVGNA